jgi:hypothetical protein
MKSPKMPGPSPEETRLKELQLKELETRTAQVDKEDARQKREKASTLASITAGRAGARSLLSGDWSGYSRGGDLGVGQ